MDLLTDSYMNECIRFAVFSRNVQHMGCYCMHAGPFVSHLCMLCLMCMHAHCVCGWLRCEHKCMLVYVLTQGWLGLLHAWTHVSSQDLQPLCVYAQCALHAYMHVWSSSSVCMICGTLHDLHACMICMYAFVVCICHLSMFLFSAYACPNWYLYTCANVA